MKTLVVLLSIAAMSEVASSGSAVAQFFYDPDGPPLVYDTQRQTWAQPVIRHSGRRLVTVPAWSAEGWRQRQEPPVPASQYSLGN